MVIHKNGISSGRVSICEVLCWNCRGHNPKHLSMNKTCVSYSHFSNDVDMETDHYSNGVAETSSNGFLNGSSKHDHEMEECDTEMGLQ